MTDFLEEALADIDSVFFQEFVEQHKIDGKPFDVVPYEMTLPVHKAVLHSQGRLRHGPKGWKADGVRRNLLHDQKLPDGARVVPGGT